MYRSLASTSFDGFAARQMPWARRARARSFRPSQNSPAAPAGLGHRRNSPMNPVMSPAATAPLTLPGVPWLAVTPHDHGATVTVGSVSTEVELTPPADGSPAVIEVAPEAVTIAELAAAGGTDPLAALPPSLGAIVGGVAISHVRIAFDAGTRSLADASIELTATQPWDIVPGRLAVHDIDVTLAIDADRALTGTARGALRVGSVDVPVELRRPAADKGWTLAIAAGDGVALPSIAELAALAGEDVAAHLPPGIEELPALVLSDVEATFAREGVESVGATIATAGSIELPDPVNLSVGKLSLTLAGEHPADAAQRVVTLSAEGSATVAGAEAMVRVERDADGWTVSGGLAPGSELTSSGVAHWLGAALPAELPDLALSELEVRAALTAGEFSIHAASDTEWTLPIGDGVAVGDLDVTFRRQSGEAGRPASVDGSVAGRIRLGGTAIDLSFSFPGELELTAKVDRIAPFALLQDVVGSATVGGLALPHEIVALSATDIALRVNVTKRELSLAASGDGVDRIQVAVHKLATSWGFAAGIKLAGGFKLSRLGVPGLDGVHLPDALIVVSSFDDPTFTLDELQPLAGKGVRTGVLLDARLDLAGLGADRLLGENKSHIDVRAEIGSSLSDLTLEASLGDVPIIDGVVLHEADFQLKPAPQAPSVALLGKIDVTPDDSPLEFIGGVKVEPNGISVQGTMLGTWKEPFGAKGVAVSDAALQVGASFEGIPSVGITGGLKVGTFDGDATVAFNSELPTQRVLGVDFNQLALMHVARTFCAPEVAASVPADVTRTLAGIGLEKVKLSIVPQDTMIGQISFKQGIHAGGTLHVAGLTASAHVDVDERDGISVDGKLSPIHVADVFSLTADDDTGEGAHLDIEIKPTAVPKIDVSGRAALLGMTAAGSVSFSDAGFHLHVMGKVFDAFDATVEARGTGLTNAPDMMVHADMHQAFLSDAAQRVAQLVEQAGTEAQAQIATAEAEVAQAKAEVAGLSRPTSAASGALAAEQATAQQQIQAAQDKVTAARQPVASINSQIEATRQTLQAERDAQSRQLAAAQEQVRQAQGAVESLNGQITGLRQQIDQRNSEIAWWRNWYNQLPWYNKTWGWARMIAEIAWRGTEVGGLWGSIGTLQGSLQDAQAVLKGYVDTLAGLHAVATFPIDQDPRMLALTGSLAGAQGLLDGANQVLAITQDATHKGIDAASAMLQGLSDQLAQATTAFDGLNAALARTREGLATATAAVDDIAQHGLGAVIDVKRASFDGTLSATSGGRVTLDADVVFMGAPKTLHASYDFGDLAAGARALAHQLVPSLAA